ncbi:hypothetical protein CRM91_19905 [Burkholderia ambifaria]|nr:hypothetical protein CRM91_19905 [Burkholderia ambifaria]
MGADRGRGTAAIVGKAAGTRRMGGPASRQDMKPGVPAAGVPALGVPAPGVPAPGIPAPGGRPSAGEPVQFSRKCLQAYLSARRRRPEYWCHRTRATRRPPCANCDSTRWTATSRPRGGGSSIAPRCRSRTATCG